jgi:hypothetical protein
MDNERQRTFKWIYLASAGVLVLITSFAILFGMQEHKDRVLSEEMTETASELQDTGERITSIRDADMKNMDDYIRAFSEMVPLLDSYDRELHKITDLYNQRHERETKLLLLGKIYRRPHLTNWENMSQILEITQALGTVLRQEAAVAQSMGQLPEPERTQFWHERFLPLEAQEKQLRAKLLIVGQRVSPAEQ